ncbi:MAG: hypothetical protein DMG85_22090 [Acidobacteria bacterium]|nr:MAG: hypothetical protein DMG85_22090 [Acidobacteriota bacterium]
MKHFSLIPAFAIAVCLLTSNALAQSPVRAQPRFPTLLKDPADTHRIVAGTMLMFGSDGTYHFTIKYSTKPDEPALRLIIYRPNQHPPATDCFTAVCWEEDVFSSSGEGSLRRFPVDPDCPPNVPCGVSLNSTADRSKLRLTMNRDSQTATLEIERQQ